MDVAHSPDSTVVVLAGIAFAYSITVLQPLNLEPTSINILLAGSIAICAMILPGISGIFEIHFLMRTGQKMRTDGMSSNRYERATFRS